jgi:hypothetical protein
VEAVLLLANAAEQPQPNGLVYALGLGWSVTGTPTPPSALVVLMKVPWDRSNERHEFELNLIDADGQPFEVSSSDGSTEPLRIRGEFEVGRPPGIPKGTPLDHTMTFGLSQGIPLRPATTYEWRLVVDGEQLTSRAFYVRPA